MTNHAPTFTSSAATGSFSETANTTDSMALHQLTGTMNFTDSDHSDTHTTSATLKSATVSGGTVIPATTLAHFGSAMTSSMVSDSNGSGKIKWSFTDVDDDFDFLAKNQTLTLTYNIKVSDDHGGSVLRTVTITVTGTEDRPVISMAATATVTEQANHTLSLSSDTAHIALNFVDQDLANTGHTATVTGVTASGNTSGILPGLLGTAELMAFFDIDNVIKNSGSSNGTINTTFSAPDLAFDYLAAGEQLNITYTVRLDDHAGGISTQNVVVTVIGTNDAPTYLCGPETAHLVEDQNLSGGNLHAEGDLPFADIDLSDAHMVSTTVTATRSGGGSIPLSNAALLAAFHTSLGPDSTGHVLGDVEWNFALSNSAASFLSGGETLTLTYHVKVQDGAGGSDVQDVTIKILGTNHPVVITSGPESTTVAEQADTTGSAAIDTTPTVPAGTLDFSDTDTGDTHTVAVTLTSTPGAAAPAATQADLATAVTTTLHDSTGTGTGSVDWNFAIADQDLDYLADGETLTVNYNIRVSDASTHSDQTVSVTLTGANDAVVMTSGPESGSVAEQAGVTGSTALDTTTPDPTGTLSFADVDLSNSHSVSVALSSALWSANPDFVPGDTLADLQAALATVLHDSTGTGTGGVDWTFSIQDQDLDFLSAGETLTATYDVTVTDGATSSTQTVTIVMNGAADPLIVTPIAVNVVDSPFSDAGQGVANGTIGALAHPIDLSTPRTITEVNGSAANVGIGVGGNFGTLFLDSAGNYAYAANSAFDQLQVGDNSTDQFNFRVDDGQGHTTTTTLTFEIAGGNDVPVITAADSFGALTEDAGPTVIVNGGFETGNLSGWTATTTGTESHISVQQFEFGGSYGHYTAQLAPTAGDVDTLSQNVATTPGAQYFVSFTLFGDPEATSSPFSASWDGSNLLSLTNVPGGVNTYTFEVIGNALLSSTSLQFSYADNGTGLLLDQVLVNPDSGPATESSSGSISFSDVEITDTHTVSFTQQGVDYLGTFSLDAVSESGGSGTFGWHYTVDNADIQFLAQGQVLTQTYAVLVTDDHGGVAAQDVTITINGTNDAPTAVGENIITDVGTSGIVNIQPWMLAANDTDTDTIDHLSFNSVVSSSGGGASGAVSFVDDGTLGGSFNYNSSDGLATSGNQATATIINNATSATALVGTGGDDIIFATNGTETLSGGGGNDILVGNSGSHVMTGGSGNDSFAFLQTSDGPGTITDFNNLTETDHIAISAGGFGGGLTAGMDVSSVFEASGDDQFSGFGAVFHFDSANRTLYFSADGTQASAITVATVQPGVTLNPHDRLIV
jgi:VCBS repeat-containing protein